MINLTALYECGFISIFGQTRSNFQIHFFLVALLFLCFDLEIVLLFPAAVTLYEIGNFGFTIFILFIVILTAGFALEIGSGAIKPASNSSDANSNGSENGYYLNNLSKTPTGSNYTSPVKQSNSWPTHPFYKIKGLKLGLINSPTRSYGILNKELSDILDLEQNKKIKSISTKDNLITLENGKEFKFIKIFNNAETLKYNIYSENRAGIYCLMKKSSLDCYIGQSINLGIRLRSYYSPARLKRLKTSIIHNSILKNGLSQFCVIILEYCEISELDNREQYYFDNFSPSYNILKFADSVRGYK